MYQKPKNDKRCVMTYNTLFLIWMATVFIYMPIVILIFIIILARTGKKLIKSDYSASPGVIFMRCLPAILLLFALSIPAFYLNKKYINYDYCKTIVKVNKITDNKNEFLLERCSFYNTDELIKNSL